MLILYRLSSYQTKFKLFLNIIQIELILFYKYTTMVLIESLGEDYLLKQK